MKSHRRPLQGDLRRPAAVSRHGLGQLGFYPRLARLGSCRLLAFLLLLFVLPLAALAQNSGINPPAPGQYPATQTNDNGCATCVGAIAAAGYNTGGQAVTISIASPAVVTDSAPITNGQVVNFTTTGALPTGLAVNTNYYVINANPGVSYQLSATAFGPAINTSGTQSGTHTRVPYALMLTSGSPQDVTALQLQPGQWQCTGILGPSTSGSSTIVNGFLTTTSNSLTGLLQGSRFYNSTAAASGVAYWGSAGPVLLQLASPTILYLDMAITYTTGTAVSNGLINCVRER